MGFIGWLPSIFNLGQLFYTPTLGVQTLSFQSVSGFSTRQDQNINTVFELDPAITALKKGGRKKAQTALFGMTWIDIRKLFVDLWQTGFQDADILLNIRNRSWQIFPVRTGHLYDAVMRDMEIQRQTDYNTRHTVTLYYQWPGDRPYPIPGHVNHFWGFGYGLPPSPPLMYPPPNVGGPIIGPRGGQLYQLNDPLALNDPLDQLNQIGATEIGNAAKDLFVGLKILLRMQMKKISGRIQVGGGGQNITAPINPNSANWY